MQYTCFKMFVRCRSLWHIINCTFALVCTLICDCNRACGSWCCLHNYTIAMYTMFIENMIVLYNNMFLIYSVLIFVSRTNFFFDVLNFTCVKEILTKKFLVPKKIRKKSFLRSCVKSKCVAASAITRQNPNGWFKWNKINSINECT